MKKGWIIAGVVVFLLVIVPGCIGIGGYNRLVQTQENVDQTWAQVENVLQRQKVLIGLQVRIPFDNHHEAPEGPFQRPSRLYLLCLAAR